MFGQVIQGHTSDPTGVRQALERWVRDLSPGAVGWVRITASVTHDGEFIAVVSSTPRRRPAPTATVGSRTGGGPTCARCSTARSPS